MRIRTNHCNLTNTCKTNVWKMTIAVLAIAAMLAVETPTVKAQSGSRGFSRPPVSRAPSSSASRPRSSSSGGRSAGSSGGSAGSRSRGRASRSNPEPLTADQVKELRDKQFQQLLVQLGHDQNRNANKFQNRLAFDNAIQDFRNLKARRIHPNHVGFQNIPFRLDQKSLDLINYTVDWPAALTKEGFEMPVQMLETVMFSSRISDAETAKEFLDELTKLNYSLNLSAARGEVGRRDFAKARRFITGLANEVHSSGIDLSKASEEKSDM